MLRHPHPLNRSCRDHTLSAARDPTRQIRWIVACPRIFYWGDLVADGLVILDRLRSTGIDAESILMDQATLDRSAPHVSPTLADGTPLPQGAPAPTPFLIRAERDILERITDPARDPTSPDRA